MISKEWHMLLTSDRHPERKDCLTFQKCKLNTLNLTHWELSMSSWKKILNLNPDKIGNQPQSVTMGECQGPIVRQLNETKSPSENNPVGTKSELVKSVGSPNDKTFKQFNREVNLMSVGCSCLTCWNNALHVEKWSHLAELQTSQWCCIPQEKLHKSANWCGQKQWNASWNNDEPIDQPNQTVSAQCQRCWGKQWQRNGIQRWQCWGHRQSRFGCLSRETLKTWNRNPILKTSNSKVSQPIKYIHALQSCLICLCHPTSPPDWQQVQQTHSCACLMQTLQRVKQRMALDWQTSEKTMNQPTTLASNTHMLASQIGVRTIVDLLWRTS